MFKQPDRRRIYLMRHAEADYQRDDGSFVADTKIVPLTALGREQAAAQGQALADIAFDKAICSGLPRTVETATIVLNAQQRPAAERPELEIVPGFEEIHTQGNGPELPPAPAAVLRQVANPWLDGARPGGRFLSGERFVEFDARVNLALAEVLDRDDWRTLLLVCHGGTNRSILNHVMGVTWGTVNLEQDNACFNIFDVDNDPDTGNPSAFVLRAVNVTAYNLNKSGLWLTTLEVSAERLGQRMADEDS